MKPIHKIIGYTEGQYDTLVFSIMFNWADIYSKESTKRMQMLLANRIINNWFRIEFAKLLKQFRADVQPFENAPGITSKERCRLFVETVTKIYEIYPAALMTEYKAAEKVYKTKSAFSEN
jgi:hypothetical protein